MPGSLAHQLKHHTNCNVATAKNPKWKCFNHRVWDSPVNFHKISFLIQVIRLCEKQTTTTKNYNINTYLTVAFRSVRKHLLTRNIYNGTNYNKQSHKNDINKSNNKTATITTTTTVASPPHHRNSISAISQLLLTRFWWNFKGRFLWTFRTDSNCHGDICPRNICPCNICPYQEYLSC